MIQFLKVFAIAFAVFMVIDFIWLVFIARKLYDRELGDLKKDKVNWPAAIIFYVLYIIGLAFFVLLPAIDRQSLTYALGGGALFGLVAYATYDLTNLATLRGFPLKITIIDLCWGTFVTALTSLLAYIILK
ncbi:MAG: DUF2177 family protein [Clostridia bacterium]|nr:DUF2177 family protein [Clostridia bacterium]